MYFGQVIVLVHNYRNIWTIAWKLQAGWFQTAISYQPTPSLKSKHIHSFAPDRETYGSPLSLSLFLSREFQWSRYAHIIVWFRSLQAKNLEWISHEIKFSNISIITWRNQRTYTLTHTQTYTRKRRYSFRLTLDATKSSLHSNLIVNRLTL